MDEFCDWPNCKCEVPRPDRCLPWRGPAMVARRERERELRNAAAQQSAPGNYAGAQQSDLGRAINKVAAAKPNEAVELSEVEMNAYMAHSRAQANAAPQYIHIVGYDAYGHGKTEAVRNLRAARRKRWLYKGAQAAFIGLLFAVGLFMACAVGFMTIWYLDGQAIEQAQMRDIQ